MNVIKIFIFVFFCKNLNLQDSVDDDRSTILFRQFEEQRNRLIEQQNNLGKQIEKCFTDYFQNDAQVEPEKVKTYCSGLFGNIMLVGFKKGMQLLVGTFKDILKIEIEPFKDMFENEIIFFFEIFDMLIDKELDLIQSFEDLKDSYFLHVQADKFENFLKIINESLKKFEGVYKLQQGIKNSIQSKIDAMVREREAYLADMVDLENTKKKL